MGLPGLGLSVCLRYGPALKDAEEKRFEYSGQILDALDKAIQPGQRDEPHPVPGHLLQ